MGFSVAVTQVLLKVNNTICQVLLAKEFWYEYYRGEKIHLSNRYPKYCQICSGFSSAVFIRECTKYPKNKWILKGWSLPNMQGTCVFLLGVPEPASVYIMAPHPQKSLC